MTARPARSADLAARLAPVACASGPFALPDGQRLHEYFDEFRLAADPRLLHDVVEAMAGLVPEHIEVLAGVELGGIPLVVALSAATGLPAAFIRRLPKRYGSMRQIEGAEVDGRHVLLVDDVVRSGRQLADVARVLRIAGALARDAMCVLERPLGGRGMLAEHGVTLHRLFDEADFSAPREAAS